VSPITSDLVVVLFLIVCVIPVVVGGLVGLVSWRRYRVKWAVPAGAVGGLLGGSLATITIKSEILLVIGAFLGACIFVVFLALAQRGR
jgi:hypothetical protein